MYFLDWNAGGCVPGVTGHLVAKWCRNVVGADGSVSAEVTRVAEYTEVDGNCAVVRNWQHTTTQTYKNTSCDGMFYVPGGDEWGDLWIPKPGEPGYVPPGESDGGSPPSGPPNQRFRDPDAPPMEDRPDEDTPWGTGSGDWRLAAR